MRTSTQIGVFALSASLSLLMLTGCLTDKSKDPLGDSNDTSGVEGSWSQSFGTNARLNAIQFVDSQTGYAAGERGTLLKTTDGGKTWARQTTGTTQGLKVLQFPTPTTGYIGGSSDTLLKTTDGGATFTRLRATTAGQSLIRISDLCFVNANTGWAVSGTAILKTNDGGASWTSSSWGPREAGSAYALLSVFFIDASNGWVVGKYNTDGSLRLRTTDGGSNWTLEATGAGFDPLQSVHFVTAQTGWTTGEYGAIRKTVDGGITWNLETSGTPQSLYSVNFADYNHGYVAGGGGTFLKTSNGGATWIHEQLPLTVGSGRSLFFVDRYTGWAAGDIADTGVIFKYSGHPH